MVRHPGEMAEIRRASLPIPRSCQSRFWEHKTPLGVLVGSPIPSDRCPAGKKCGIKLLRKDKIIDWWMKGEIGPLYILWVNFRVAEGNFTWNPAFSYDYLRWGCSSAGVFVYRLTSCAGVFVYHPLSRSSLTCVALVLVLVPAYSYSSVFVHTYRLTTTPMSVATLRTCSA